MKFPSLLLFSSANFGLMCVLAHLPPCENLTLVVELGVWAPLRLDESVLERRGSHSESYAMRWCESG